MKNSDFSIDHMMIAIECAKKAYSKDEVPVGAVIVRDGKIIGKGWNTILENQSVSAHAEINAINVASSYLKNYRLVNCDIYTTLEPCHMCAKAIVDARIRNLFFGALEPKTGAIVSTDSFLDESHLNHRVNYEYGFMKNESIKLLMSFFKSKRD